MRVYVKILSETRNGSLSIGRLHQVQEGRTAAFHRVLDLFLPSDQKFAAQKLTRTFVYELIFVHNLRSDVRFVEQFVFKFARFGLIDHLFLIVFTGNSFISITDFLIIPVIVLLRLTQLKLLTEWLRGQHKQSVHYRTLCFYPLYSSFFVQF